jgi:two-component system sensor histidine kinase MprB
MYVGILQRMLLAISGQARSLSGLMSMRQTSAARENVDVRDLIDRQIVAISALTESDRVFQRDGWRKAILSLTPTEQTLAEIVFYNVLHNAVKFSPPDHAVRVCMAISIVGDMTIAIEDHGPGIATADLPMVFTEGFRRRADGWPDGTGMGLAGVADALVNLGWQRSLESWPGKGTRFSVVVPKEKVTYG